MNVVVFTILIAAVSTACIAPFALALAAWSWRAGARAAVVYAVAALPLVLPPTAVGFRLLELFARRGPLGWLHVLFTPAAVVIACGVMSFPLMFTAFRLPLANFTLEARCTLAAQVTALVGRSGSGKTSLIESIAGLRAAKGRIAIDGIPIQDEPPERRSIGYVPQDVALFPHLSVRDNVRFGGRDEERFASLRDTLELGPLLDRAPASLSGGERPTSISSRNLIEAEVTSMTEREGVVDLVAGTIRVRITRAAADDLRLRAGSRVWLALRGRSFRVVG